MFTQKLPLNGIKVYYITSQETESLVQKVAVEIRDRRSDKVFSWLVKKVHYLTSENLLSWRFQQK